MPAESLILVVDDDPELRKLLRAALEADGHRVLEAEGAELGLHLLRTRKPGLVILDRGLPDGEGVEVLRKIRAGSERTTPVIMLTAQGALEEKTEAFTAGADQYLVKPVEVKELILWVQALLRRLSFDRGDGDVLEVGELAIDVRAHQVRYKDVRVTNLTVKEFELFYFLVRKRPQVFSRQAILSSLWHTITVDHVVDTHISNLRRKLPPEVSDRIQNVPGRGFRFLD